MFVHIKQFIILGFSLLMALQGVFAESGITVGESAEKIETLVVTATRDQTSASNHPDVFVIDISQLDVIQSQHIQELLVTVPGISMQRGNGQEYLPAIRSPVFTGAGSCGAILTAEDGVPVRSAGFCNVNELFETHSEAAAQIEVVRGSGTSLYGSNALHGLINVITPSPEQTPKRWSIETGSDDYARVKFSNSFGRQHQLATLFTATHDGGFRAESGYDQQKLSLRYSTQIDGYDINAGLTATNLNQETAGFITGLDSYLDAEQVSSNPTPEAYRDARSLRAWLKFESTFTDTTSFMFMPYARHTDMQFLQHFLPGDPLEENGQTGAGFQSAIYASLTPTLELISGLDAELTQAFLKQSQDTPTQGSAFLVATIPEGQHYDYEVDATTLAAFVYGDWQLADSWKLIAGIRYETVDYNYDNRMLDGRTRDDGSECGFGGCRYSRPSDRSDRFNNLSSHFQINKDLNEYWSAYVKWSKAYRLPQATELYRLQRDQTEANLDPETLQGIELAATLTTARLNAQLSLYEQDKENYIFRDSDFFNVSNGQTSHRGVELFIDASLTNSLSLAINANTAIHQYDFDRVLNDVNINGNDVDTAPRRFGSISLTWDMSSKLSSQLQFNHMGDYYLDPENLHSYPGHNLWNLSAHYQFNPDWNLSLRVNNLLDEKYAERADYTSFTDERYFPGRERSVFLRVEKRF